MLRGDLSTMPLTDLLQWVDMARKSVVVEVERPAGVRPWLRAAQREIVAASVPQTSGHLVADGTPRAPGPGLRALCVEGVLDLFFESAGTFVVHDGASAAPPPDAGVPLAVPLGFVVMEGMRQLDDWPRLDALYPDERARIVRRAAPSVATELGVVQQAILAALDVPRSLAETRIVLGLSHRALLRRLDELVSLRLVEVDGARSGETERGADLSLTLAEQARALLFERQFAEAAHVLRSLLLARPEDASLLRLLEETERQHTAACREELRRSDLVRALPGLVRPPRLSPAEQGVLDALAPKPRSVAGLVLGSSRRELETLVAILALRKKGFVQIDSGA